MTPSLETQLADALLRAETAEALLEAERDKVERLEVELAVAKGDVNGMDRAALEKALKELDAKDGEPQVGSASWIRQMRAEAAAESMRRIVPTGFTPKELEDIHRIMMDMPIQREAFEREYPRVREERSEELWKVDFEQRIDNYAVIMRVQKRGGPAYNITINMYEYMRRGQQYIGERIKQIAAYYRGVGDDISARDANYLMVRAMQHLSRISPTGRYTGYDKGYEISPSKLSYEELERIFREERKVKPPSPKSQFDKTPKSPKKGI